MSLTVCFVTLNIKSNINNTWICKHFSLSVFFFIILKGMASPNYLFIFIVLIEKPEQQLQILHTVHLKA